jgi:hypothetical protein
MNWKEFLRPDGRKIVLSFISAILLFLFGFITGIGGDIFVGYPILNTISLILLVFTLEFKITFGVEIIELPNIFEDFLSIIIYWFCLYLLSCFIVWIYDKNFKKVKKKK